MGNRYKVVDCCVVRENGDHAPCGNAELACQRLNDGLVGEVMYNWYPECTNHPLTMPTSLPDQLRWVADNQGAYQVFATAEDHAALLRKAAEQVEELKAALKRSEEDVQRLKIELAELELRRKNDAIGSCAVVCHLKDQHSVSLKNKNTTIERLKDRVKELDRLLAEQRSQLNDLRAVHQLLTEHRDNYRSKVVDLEMSPHEILNGLNGVQVACLKQFLMTWHHVGPGEYGEFDVIAYLCRACGWSIPAVGHTMTVGLPSGTYEIKRVPV